MTHWLYNIEHHFKYELFRAPAYPRPLLWRIGMSTANASNPDYDSLKSNPTWRPLQTIGTADKSGHIDPDRAL